MDGVASPKIQHLGRITDKFPSELRDGRSNGVDISVGICKAELLNHSSKTLVPPLLVSRRQGRSIVRTQYFKQFVICEVSVLS